MRAQELLDLIDTDTIIAIMDDLGSPVYKRGTTNDGQEYLTFKTICHQGHSEKLFYYQATKSFYCYTNCGAMSLFDLVKKVKGYTDNEFYLVMIYIADKAGVKLGRNRHEVGESFSKDIHEDIAEMDRLIEIAERKQHKSVHEIKKFYDADILNYFDGDTFYKGWIDEGISIDSMRKYNIRYYYLESHIIIPHYNINGDLVGIRRRSLNPDDSKNKYMPEFIGGQDYGHPLGLNLYGIDKNQEAIRKQHKVVIVEGEKSVLLSDTYYGNKSVALATCGFNISEWQIKALKKLGVNTVYLGFDKDYDTELEDEYRKDPLQWSLYQQYVHRLDTLAARLAPDFTTYLIKDKEGLLQLKDSPMDRGKKTFEALLKKAKMVTTQGKSKEFF